MKDINYLLLQILMVILPIFVHQTIFKEKFYNDNKIMKVYTFMFWLIGITCCMFLSTFLNSEYRFDLRTIPITEGFLFGGLLPGIFLALYSIFLRLYLGGIPGTYQYVLTLLFYIPCIMAVLNWFRTANRHLRTRLFILLNILPFCCSWLSLFLLGDRQFLVSSFNLNFFIYLLVAVTASWITIFLLESMRENMQMRLELYHAEKMKLMRDLSSVFAHEIRNPMQIARGFLQLLSTPELSNEKRSSYIQFSIEELDRANEIINDFLSLAKPSNEGKQFLEIGNHLLHITNLIQPYASSCNVTIETQFGEDCWIAVNPQKLSQCLINLIKNAIESMPEGGKVDIHTYSAKHGNSVIKITDHGIGMSKEHLQRLGRPYYTLKERGTGIGLMVTFQIIESFQGTVKVKSEKGKGTTITIELPQAQPVSKDISGS